MLVDGNMERGRRGQLLVAWLLLSSAACRRPPADDVQTEAPAQPSLAAPSPAPGAGGAGEQPVTIAPAPTSQAMLTVNGQQVRIAEAEALAVRAALVASIQASNVPYKEQLLGETKDAPIGFEPDLARIGLWILSAPNGTMQLMYREPSDDPVTFFYRAKVENRAGHWEVRDLTRGEMRRRR